MARVALIVIGILLIPYLSFAELIDVHIKGIDDGKKTSKQQDYKEAVLFAKREAIERAGMNIKSITTVKDLIIESDYIETQAKAALMPGYNIVDIGYQSDGTYMIVLVGKVKPSIQKNELKEYRGLKIIDDDFRYVRYENGVVLDKETQLEWLNFNRWASWNEASRMVTTEKKAGGWWRMPTLGELRSLYKRGLGLYNMTPMLNGSLDVRRIWSGDQIAFGSGIPHYYYFDFYKGNEDWMIMNNTNFNVSIFGVRSKNQ